MLKLGVVHEGRIHVTVKEKLDKVGVEDFEISPEEFLRLLKEENYDLSLDADVMGDLEIKDIDSSTTDLEFCISNINGNFTLRDCTIDSLSLEHTCIYGKLVIENVVVTGNLVMPENLEDIIVHHGGVSIKNLQVMGQIHFQRP